jgi:hypothetical protein
MQLRASPLVLGMWLQRVKSVVTRSKCASSAQEIVFSAPNLCSLASLVKGATQLCTSKKECNKLDLTAAQYFWLVDRNDWSRWLAISSSHVYAVPVTVLLVGLQKTKAKLRHLIWLSRVTYWAAAEMLLVFAAKVIILDTSWCCPAKKILIFFFYCIP